MPSGRPESPPEPHEAAGPRAALNMLDRATRPLAGLNQPNGTLQNAAQLLQGAGLSASAPPQTANPLRRAGRAAWLGTCSSSATECQSECPMSSRTQAGGNCPMKNSAVKRIATAVALAACLALVGCGSGPPTAPGIQPQISNLPDDFSYQVSSVGNFTGAAPYSWQNTGISANINQSTTVTSGSMTLVITDANGTQVYSRSLSENGTFVTANGVAGTWTIRITYVGASGTVNFRAQKKT